MKPATARKAASSVIAIAGGCLLAAGCSQTVCTLEARAGLAVGVDDATTGAAVCGAHVVATEGAYAETLREYPLSMPEEGDAGIAACSYAGAVERAGTYALTVSAPGYRTTTVENVTVSRDACHVIARSVTIRLDPG
jgi:hypothetical protein